MPAGGVQKVGHADLLSYEELLRVAEAAVGIGVEKIRVTGGEPLVRKGVVGFLERLAATQGLRRLVLTTNGILLKEMAAGLRKAGLESINISIDSLRPETFVKITRGGDLLQVLAGMEAVERAGFPFVKINVVVMRGINDDEIEDFAALTIDRPYRVRFIEYMPTLKGEDQQMLTVPGSEVLERLSHRFRLEPATREEYAGPAVKYRIPGSAGMIGIITPVSSHFCGNCNRIRVTSTGMAKSCLFAEGRVDLRSYLRSGDDAGLRQALCQVVAEKPALTPLGSGDGRLEPVAMSRVGG
jgi:cyclic pyranopterin phosphate synthase